jgi:hypothetical protein
LRHTDAIDEDLWIQSTRLRFCGGSAYPITKTGHLLFEPGDSRVPTPSLDNTGVTQELHVNGGMYWAASLEERAKAPIDR